jgi:hypothetical protein
MTFIIGLAVGVLAGVLISWLGMSHRVKKISNAYYWLRRPRT